MLYLFKKYLLVQANLFSYFLFDFCLQNKPNIKNTIAKITQNKIKLYGIGAEKYHRKRTKITKEADKNEKIHVKTFNLFILTI